MHPTMRVIRAVGFSAAVFGLVAPAAQAGVLDKLNEVTKKLNAASQQSSQEQGGQHSSGGSLSSALGATNLHGLTDYNSCMAQTAGAHEKLTVQALRRKLGTSNDLSAQQRRTINEDIQWLEATAAGGRPPAPNPKDPQRYLSQLTDDEQVEINSANNRFASDVRERCEAQYGGMSQFADPAGRRHAPIETRVPFPVLSGTAPVHVATPEEARHAAAQDQAKNCMGSLQGLRWQLMAERMEQKLQTLSNLPAQERHAWEEDIAVVQAAAQSTTPTKAMPQSPDPKNPMRYMMRLSPDDQAAMNQDYAARSRQLMASCNGGGGSPAASTWSVETSKTAQRSREARERTGRTSMQPADAAKIAQAWLDAHPARATHPTTTVSSSTVAEYMERGGVLACFERMKGFRAEQLADRLTAKRASVAAEDRQELNAWITAWRAAQQAKQDDVTPPSGVPPQGYLRFLTNTEQQEMNMVYSAAHNKVQEECSGMDHMETGKRL